MINLAFIETADKLLWCTARSGFIGLFSSLCYRSE